MRGALFAQHEQGWTFSPFGVWLLLCVALAGAAADDRQRLEDAVGCSADEAQRLLSSLLSSVPPAIATAIAVWIRETAASELFEQWVGRLPEQIETGQMPSQAEADAWTRRNTLQLIESFPGQVDDLDACLVSAVATRVSWRVPFEVIDAAEILPSDSPWHGAVDELLHAPVPYGASIVETARAGKVAVYQADAEEDVSVVCVSAGPDVARDRVLEAAQETVMNMFAHGQMSKCSLFDLDVGVGHSWTVTERERLAWQPGQRFERFSDAYLPAWTQQSTTDLLASDTFAADAAIAALQRATSTSGPTAAQQTAIARFDRYGFEAAAVTTMGWAVSGKPRDPTETGLERIAQLRLDHPFAAIAVDSSTSLDSPTWSGLPLFEAWVTSPKEPEPERDRPTMSRGAITPNR
jgi:Serpin (serine protease inhibitor)